MMHSEVFEQSQWPQNPLAAVREAFGWLMVGPNPVVVDGRVFDGLPDRDVSLAELRDTLLDPDCPQGSRDQVWRHVIKRARTERGTWMLVAAGLALPMLTPIAGWLTEHSDDDPHDLCAEALRGLLDEVRTVDLDRGGIATRLRWAAYRAARRAVSRTLLSPDPVDDADFTSNEPTRPSGHPDLVLARAVRSGVLTQTEADLISFNRLDKQPLTDWPRPDGMTYEALRWARRTAETRLAAWLTDKAEDAETTPSAEEVPDAGDASTQKPKTASRSRKVVNKVEAPNTARDTKTGLHGCG